MLQFNQLYKPITATPFLQTEIYIEVAPCDALKPYIRCFWGHKKPQLIKKIGISVEELVVPDTCMDIIFNINYTENKIENLFCGINNEAFSISDTYDKEELVSVFAIRFYPWAAILFSDEPMNNVKNEMFDVGQYYSKIKQTMEPLLFEVATIEERITIAERVLMDNLHLERMHSVLNEAIFQIMKYRGNIQVTQLAKEVHISSRQLERLLKYHVGVSPKQLTSLMRYQYLWHDILLGEKFNLLDAVERYGYTDQAHLLHDFKRYHTMSPNEARQYALNNRGS